jgi:hypothetical protein
MLCRHVPARVPHNVATSPDINFDLSYLSSHSYFDSVEDDIASSYTDNITWNRDDVPSNVMLCQDV